MQKLLSDYLDSVCAPVKNAALKKQVRQELAVHLQERYADLLQEGMSENDAARRTVEKFGDGAMLGRKIVQANRSGKKWMLAAIGVLGVIFVWFATIYMSGMILVDYMDIAGLFVVIGISVAFALLATANGFSWQSFWHNMRFTAIIGGLIGGGMGIINTLHRFQDAVWPIMIAVALLCPLYGMLLSGFAFGAENFCKAPENAVWKQLLE